MSDPRKPGEASFAKPAPEQPPAPAAEPVEKAPAPAADKPTKPAKE